MSSKFPLGWAVLALLMGLMLLGAIQDAHAQACGTPDKYATTVKKYGEKSVFIGVNRNGVIVEITVNPNTGTWSAWGHMRNRVCLADAGKNGMANPVRKKKPAGVRKDPTQPEVEG